MMELPQNAIDWIHADLADRSAKVSYHPSADPWLPATREGILSTYLYPLLAKARDDSAASDIIMQADSCSNHVAITSQRACKTWLAYLDNPVGHEQPREAYDKIVAGFDRAIRLYETTK